MSEDREHEPREGLSRAEEHAVEEHLKLRAPAIYEVVRREGVEELQRPAGSLWWSGIAAGLAVSSSVYTQAFLYAALPDGAAWVPLITSFGYALGFLFVVLGRLQLFTEDTITVVLPLLAEPGLRKVLQAIRLWLIVFAANLVGTCLSAAFVYFGGVSGDGAATVLEIAAGHADRGFWATVAYGVPAGFLVAALVWTLPNAHGGGVLLIVIVSYVIALGGFAHVVVGSTESFLLVFAGQKGIFEAALFSIIPAFIGNVVGGTGLFAVIAYGQVREEL